MEAVELENSGSVYDNDGRDGVLTTEEKIIMSEIEMSFSNPIVSVS